MIRLIFYKKIINFVTNKTEGVSPVKMIHCTQIFRKMDQNWCKRKNITGQKVSSFSIIQVY